MISLASGWLDVFKSTNGSNAGDQGTGAACNKQSIGILLLVIAIYINTYKHNQLTFNMSMAHFNLVSSLCMVIVQRMARSCHMLRLRRPRIKYSMYLETNRMHTQFINQVIRLPFRFLAYRIITGIRTDPFSLNIACKKFAITFCKLFILTRRNISNAVSSVEFCKNKKKTKANSFIPLHGRACGC